jgi:hypothetical protein
MNRKPLVPMAALAFGWPTAVLAQSEGTKPNVLFILADNLGFGAAARREGRRRRASTSWRRRGCVSPT